MNKFNRFYIYKIIALIFTVSGICFSMYVLCKMRNEQSIVTETSEIKVSDCQYYRDSRDSRDKNNLKQSPCKTLPIQKKVNLCPILCLLYFLILTGTFSVLFAIIMKDDSEIRFEKLKELEKARQELIDTVSYKEYNIEEHKSEKKENSTFVKNSIKADLVKQYMKCIQDI